MLKGLDFQTVLDGMGQGILIFDGANRLVLDNVAARTFLGNDLRLIRAEGWAAVTALFNARQTNSHKGIDAARTQALNSARPIRFNIYRAGEYIPCWAAAVQGSGGEVYTMITIDSPDWGALSELMDRFFHEVRDAIEGTQGHADLIMQSLKRPKPNESVEQLSRRISGFTRLISTQMHRQRVLVEMLERLEEVRTGKLREDVRASRRKIELADFMENFLESLDETPLVDPETAEQDYRGRLKADIPEDLALYASPVYLSRTLRDLLRNAIMYSMRGTPVKIIARADKDQSVQIDVIDEGYGIRASESDRVFEPFQRARQPQIISEFGYGLSLYLCKYEIEAMNGRIWFESAEKVGTTFSFKLPVWREAAHGIKGSEEETAEMPAQPKSAVSSAGAADSIPVVP